MKTGWLILAVLLFFPINALAATGSDACNIPKELTLTPPKVSGEPVKVAVSVFIIDIVEVDEIKESFKADYTVAMRWQDPRLSKQSRGISLIGCNVTLDDIWDPKILPLNVRNPSQIFFSQVSVDDAGNVALSVRLHTHYSSTFDLHEFPFDQQTLQMHLASFEYGPNDVVMKIDEKNTGRLDGIESAGWFILANASDASVPPIVAVGEEFSHLFHTIVIKRKAGYYILKFVIPLCFIVLMAGSVFWLDPESFVAQIGISTASVFTLVAFLIGLRQGLPQVAYLTSMDEMILAATILVFVSFAEVVYVSRLVNKGNAERARRVDFHARWIYLLMFIALVYRIIVAPFFD